jgi:predicted nucleic acid-binding protein
MKTKLYLDTSIPSAYFDHSKPLRQLITQKWFTFDSSSYELYISVIAVEEIERMANVQKRQSIKDLLLTHEMKILELTGNAVKLARAYVKHGAIPKSEPEDAYHIAIATVHNIEAIASWNFKHIVSINPIKKIHEINLKFNYPIIEIGTLELFGGSKYGSL